MTDATATIYSYTVIRSAPPEFVDRTPYCVAVLEDPDGSRFTAFVDGYTDGMEIAIGQPVQRRSVTADGEYPHYHF